MKKVFTHFQLLMLLSLGAFAQKAPSNFVTEKESAAEHTYSIPGYRDPYSPETNFTLHFGKENAGAPGYNRVIRSFQVDGRTYVRGEQGNTPFTKVVLKRIDNSVTGNKATAFFEVQGDQEDGVIYLQPDYVNEMEGLINSYVFNRGSDNVMSNNNQTHNNVERIDLIFENGIKAPASPALLNRSGILIMERGGNDSFKFAAIKQLAGGEVSALGDLKQADAGSAWGSTLVSMQTMVFQRDGGEGGNMRPSQLITPQEVNGTFITLQDLGLSPGEMFYGISLFANDVTATGEALVDLSSGFPTDTDGQANGGLDFLAGGGFFMVENNVGGKVFHDAAPDPTSINSHTGGMDGSLTYGLPLFVSLLDNGGTILSTTPVENGTFTFYDVANGSYSLVLHQTPEGSTTPSLPAGWYTTGEGKNATKDGEPNGIISFEIPNGVLIMNNFGINASIQANDDDFGSRPSTVAYTTPGTIFVNDILNSSEVQGAAVILSVGGIEVTSPVSLIKEGVEENKVRLQADGTVTVDAGAPEGTYTLTYSICDRANPSRCDDAVITIRVEATRAIVAEDDDFGSIYSTAFYTAPRSILENDSLNHGQVDPSAVDLKVGGTLVSSPVVFKNAADEQDAPGVKLHPDGSVTVDEGTPVGEYKLEYSICEIANPDNCDPAWITISVKDFRPIVAHDDDYGIVSSHEDFSSTELVFKNDSLAQAPVVPSEIIFKVNGTELTSPVSFLKDGVEAEGVKLHPDGSVSVAQGTEAGTYTLNYSICERDNAVNCDDAQVIIRVGEFDLALEKRVKAGQKAVFKEGDEVTFELVLKNEGTIDASTIQLVDYVPDGLELISTEWSLADGKAKLNTPVPSLAAGEEIILEITFKVKSDAKPNLRNAAEISSAEGGKDKDSTPDEGPFNDPEEEDDHDAVQITVCKKGGNCLPVKTTRIK
jgi:uncharacterized repeat protein (TIGR01451 family)